MISTEVALHGLNRDFAYNRSLLVPEPLIGRQFIEPAGSHHGQVTKFGETNEKLRAARDLLVPRQMSGEIKV